MFAWRNSDSKSLIAGTKVRGFLGPARATPAELRVVDPRRVHQGGQIHLEILIKASLGNGYSEGKPASQSFNGHRQTLQSFMELFVVQRVPASPNEFEV